MTNQQPPEDLIRYDVLTQDALRDVIRKVLEEVSVSGLPGEHHFFITFNTGHPGVRLSARMRERYPEEMTIVIQHSFWDLKVTEAGFEIDLSFDDILERLRVPFASLKGFFDPYVKFGVQFDSEHLEAANVDSDPDGTPENLPQPAQTREMVSADDAEHSGKDGEAEAATEASDDEPAEGAEIVSLDKFRKNK